MPIAGLTPGYNDSNGLGETNAVLAPITIADNANRVAYAALLTDNAAVTGLAATFNGVAMSAFNSYEVNGQNIYVYQMIAPPVGAFDCGMTWNEIINFVFLAFDFYDVNQGSPVRPSTYNATGNAGSANPSVATLDSAVGDLVVAILNENNNDTITDGAGQTRVVENLQGANGITAGVVTSKAGAAGAVTSSWTAASNRWSAAAFSLQPPVTVSWPAFFYQRPNSLLRM